MGLFQSNHLEDLSDDDQSDYELAGSAKRMSEERETEPSDIAVDAVSKLTISLPTAKDVLNLESLALIEKQLKIGEIISLLYLVVDPNETHYALQQSCLLLKNPGAVILQEWAKMKAEKNWENTLIEAICVIKNYKVLKQLGFTKKICKQHFLPHIHNTSLNLNVLRKTCYLICEELDQISTDKLLQHFESTSQIMNYEYQYLELFFLKFEIDNRNIAEITQALKVIEEDKLYDTLKSFDRSKIESKPTHQVDKADQSFESKPTNSTSIDTHAKLNKGIISNNILFESLNISPSVILEEVEDRYRINLANPGTVLIINQDHFYTEFNEMYKHLLPNELKEKLDSRTGSEKDRDHLCKLFTNYGFKVIVENNLTHLEMESKIKQVVNEICEESSLFVCILSHGDKGIVYAANSCVMKVSNIQQILCKTNRKHLNGKPKVLIIQACQGEECQKVGSDVSDTEDEENEITVDGGLSKGGTVPAATDMLTFWATVPGYAAIRDKKKGTWFIQTLCKVIEENSHNLHLSDICTKVVNEVTSMNYQKSGMTPMVVHTFRFPFYFPPLKE